MPYSALFRGARTVYDAYNSLDPASQQYVMGLTQYAAQSAGNAVRRVFSRTPSVSTRRSLRGSYRPRIVPSSLLVVDRPLSHPASARPRASVVVSRPAGYRMRGFGPLRARNLDRRRRRLFRRRSRRSRR